ncbi:LacI family DNA-binding transcriptional regulator [Bifidobacterium bombi]|uniref:Transcriptional regulator, LacI family n=1 Tax=Bifidobacterium bombi DSM 19703 TaxID=1341695 RepID=A0A080N3Y2_9BIFI|nr:LacI family DNA-binding transcriptional regulator [Bifidobacterium bombi]KFF30885.1 transcriptional regulator, LacI family [Bifidobacterium bombi DSM 19703]
MEDDGVNARRGRVSLKDVADDLGISQTAVSFAVNDRPGVSKETKERVKEAVERLGWSPVYAAQALSSSKTMTVGFAPSRSHSNLQSESFMLHFMSGLHDSLSRQGYGLLFRPTSSLREEVETYRDWGRRKRVDGVVLVDLRSDDPRPQLLRGIGIRTVLAGGPDPSNLIPSLSIDDSGTMAKVIEHLVQAGHSHIAYFAGNENLDYSKARVASFIKLAQQDHLRAPTVVPTRFDTQLAVRKTCGLMASPDPPTAFIYENETMAAASQRALEELMANRGVVAPGGESFASKEGSVAMPHLPAIVSFEDSFVCSAVYPSITAVHRDPAEYGKKVARLLIKDMDGEHVAGNRRILAPRLVVRESTSWTVD